MAVPVLETGYTTATTGGGTAASLVITKPTGVVTDDLLLIIAGSDDTGGGAGFNNITGFTKFDDRDTGNGAKLAGFWRVSDETEGASETISVTSNDEIWGFYCRISGCDTTTPVYTAGIAVGTVASSTNHSKTNGAVSAATDNLCITALAFDGGDGVPFALSTSGAWGDNAILTDIQSGTSGNDACGTIITGTVPWIQNGVGRSIGITSSIADGSNYFAVCIQSVDPAGALDKLNGITIATGRPPPSKFNGIAAQNMFNILGIPLK